MGGAGERSGSHISQVAHTTLAQLLPKTAATMRAESNSVAKRDLFADFVMECVQTAEEIDIEDDVDIAVFTAVVTLADK